MNWVLGELNKPQISPISQEHIDRIKVKMIRALEIFQKIWLKNQPPLPNEKLYYFRFIVLLQKKDVTSAFIELEWKVPSNRKFNIK